ncbi:MAG: hypothetical protein LBL04_13135 [Bacteroidales bacterium]|nr:hypothetical protein [Bacteroidales bacterium]
MKRFHRVFAACSVHGVDDGKFFLQNYGFLSDYTIMGSTFSRPATGIEPVIEWKQLE